MKPAVWRAIAVVCITAAIAFALYQPTLPQADDLGLTVAVGRSPHGQALVTSVRPGSQAAGARIHPGDGISYGNTALQRARAQFALPGSPVPLVIDGTRTVVLTAQRMPPVGDWGVTAVRLAFLLVAALLAWRRPEDAGVRYLVFFLWCYGCAIALPNGLLPWPALSLALSIAAGVLLVLGTAAAAGFAANFPARTNNGGARTTSVVAQGVAVATACAMVIAAWDPAVYTVVIAGFALVVFLAAGVFVTAYVRGAAGERQRRRWVFLILGFALCGLVADVLATSISGRVVPVVDELALVPLGLLPIGLAYVILRHRVIDVGFVLNRAVVYTGVSLVIVGVFVIVETLLAKYVESTSHATSITVQMAVALGLGFSVRYIHARVDRFVDAALFRERHLAEAAIRTFAHDAAYVTDANILAGRCIDAVERYMHAHGAGLWLARDDGTYQAIASTLPQGPAAGENDPAILAMRARRVVVDLRESGSVLPGTIAFPMIVRGELMGALACGPKPGDESYAPDERDCLAALASAVGHALESIEVRELRKRLAELAGPSALATGGTRGRF